MLKKITHYLALPLSLRWYFFCFVGFLCVVLGGVSVKTHQEFRDPYPDFKALLSSGEPLHVLDRNRQPLAISYQERWNLHEQILFHEVPDFLIQAFLRAEDKRFFLHGGVDWRARAAALWDRFRRGRWTRGASTITEQVVRMLHPRPRTYFSKWIEGREAEALEKKVDKISILEFYLNQVPYAANRRGIVQAARYYFNRPVTTLNRQEMLALALLVRAPSKFDLRRGNISLHASQTRLDRALAHHNPWDESQPPSLSLIASKRPTHFEESRLEIEAAPFVAHVREEIRRHRPLKLRRGRDFSPPLATKQKADIVTTLEGSLQKFVSSLLENRLSFLKHKNVHQAAALVIDHQSQEILAWVSVGAECKSTVYRAPGCKIDMVRTPRQPGSTLKPFFYAEALDQGWSANKILLDAPHENAVGRGGLHHFRNYSHKYYGNITLRQALGNSLNIPAIHTLNYIGIERGLGKLHALGFRHLTETAEFYREGLALGSGEVTLLELAQAYSVLARGGQWKELKIFSQPLFLRAEEGQQIFSPPSVARISDILSDPWSRSWEFGRYSVLNFPLQTAVKTGTSTAYRDAWAVGYNYKYLVAIWMGNADYSPMDHVSGAAGPALSLRAIVNYLMQGKPSQALYAQTYLESEARCFTRRNKKICDQTGRDREISEINRSIEGRPSPLFQILRPTDGLEMAIDPRVPLTYQAFEMRVSGIREGDEIEWRIDMQTQGKKKDPHFLWPAQRGRHEVQAILWRGDKKISETEKRTFIVK